MHFKKKNQHFTPIMFLFINGSENSCIQDRQGGDGRLKTVKFLRGLKEAFHFTGPLSPSPFFSGVTNVLIFVRNPFIHAVSESFHFRSIESLQHSPMHRKIGSLHFLQDRLCYVLHLHRLVHFQKSKQRGGEHTCASYRHSQLRLRGL